MPKLKEVLANRGFVEFLIKGVAFILLLILELQLVVWKENLIPVNTAWFSLNIGGFGTNTPIRLILFLVIAFVLLSKQQLLDIKKFRFRVPVFAFYFSISMFFAWLLKVFRAAIASNQELIQNYFWAMLFLKFFLPAMLLITLFLSVFGFNMVSFLWRKLRKEIGISVLFTFIFFQLIDLFQKIWPYFSRAVVESVSFLLRFSFSNVTKNLTDLSSPGLSVNRISIQIGKACSGIDSQILFIFLFAIILFMDWNEINKLKAFLLFIPGAVGMFCMNIIRIYLLYIMALYISTDFALTAFHSNIGWILFVFYFVAFEYFTYNWMRK